MTPSPSLWSQAAAPEARHSLPPDAPPRSADVVIVGGGFTGLWTAYYLLRSRPDLSVVILEAEHVGFGASGRNGGWVSALWPVSPDTLAARYGRTATLAHLAELRSTVDEVGSVCRDEGIEADFVKGGTLYLARTRAQLARAREACESEAAWGLGTEWLSAHEATERFAAAGVLGATTNPHCARVHPRKLVDGLANAVRRRGATIVEGQRVRDLEPGRVTLSDGGTIAARHIIRATEAWSSQLPRSARAVAPVYSLMVATEPLPAALWDRIGLRRREVFADYGHVVIYGQRTADDRIAFGGRGAPYHFGSRISSEFDTDEAVFEQIRRTLRDLLPQLGPTRFTHAWGGPLGIPRDWHPSVTYDPATGIGAAGGYVGDGVAATNLAGRTLSALITGASDPVTALPWVGHRCPDWEPEPVRWLGVNAGLRLAHLADAEERVTGQPARLGRVLSALTGH